MLRRTRRSRRRRELHRISSLQRLRRAVDHAVRRQKTGGHLDTISKVAAKLHGLQLHLIVLTKNGNLHALVDRHQGRRRPRTMLGSLGS